MINLDFSIQTIEGRIGYLNNLLNNSDNNFTNKDLEKMGEYLLYLFDDNFNLNDRRKESHERVNKDNAKGIKTYVVPKKDNIEKKYDETKKIQLIGNIIDLLCIEENIKNLKELKKLIKEYDYTFFTKKNLSKKKIIEDINKDISDLTEGKRLFLTKSHGGEINRHDKINLDDVDYANENFIYEILKNMQYIELQSPPSNLFFICMDFIDATKNINFTKHQQEVLYKIRNGENISDEGQNIKHILKKYSNYFKKNRK